MAEITERPNLVLPNIVRSNNNRSRKNIAQWRSALTAAENVDNPRRLLLYNLYDEILLDADLTAEVQKRISAMIKRSFKVYDKNGKINTEGTDMLKRAWFTKLIEYALESKLWGHSLVEINKLTGEGKVADVKLVPRRHVRPEYGMIIIKQTDDKGTLYREDVNLDKYLFEFGSPDDLGLLNKAVPHVLFSRFAQSAWSEFCEIFGMPIRYGKTNTKDVNSLNRMEDMLINMATASYGVMDKDEELAFIESQRTNGDVYKGLMTISTSKIARLINGSMIGENTEKGSQAKETVGKEIQQDIFDGDKKWFEALMNEEIMPKLIALGYPFSDHVFEFESAKNIEEEWKLVSGILNHYDISPEYISENFGVPVEAKVQNTLSTIAKSSQSFFE